MITPSLNSARYIGEAIQSVLIQDCSNVEHIVADGGSTDGTLEILGRHLHLKILSSPDRGMYDALNRGLAVAAGELIGILNSDDCYAEGAFSAVVEAFRDESVMALTGEAHSFRDCASGDRVVVERFSPVGADVLLRSTLGNPSMNAWFFRASVFATIGCFDPTYRVAGDREFMLRFALSGLRYAETSRLICRYRVHPGSMTFGAGEATSDTVRREHDKMTGHYLGQPGLTKRARDLIRRARTRDTIRAAIRSARQFDVRKLMSCATAGTRHDPLWPARFAARAAHLVALKMRFRGWSGRP